MVVSLTLVGLGLGVVLISLLVFRLHAFLAMILAAMTVALLTPKADLQSFATQQVKAGKLSEKQGTALANASAPSRVLDAFGDACGKIGILIAMAAIIGKCLLDSGAAMRLVQAILAVFGQTRAHIAFVLTGFLLAIPVYFDAVFYLLMPIGKAMAARFPRNYVLYVLTIVAGATMAHSLVPPTPGPLFAAKALNVDLATMIVGGLAVGLCTASFGLVYALWANKRWQIAVPEDASPASTMESDNLPPLALALLPLILPVALITTGALWKEFWFTDNSVAISVGAIVAIFLLARHRRPGSESVHDAVQSALMSGATILLITAAGGAFGAVLRQTGVADAIQTLGSDAAQTWALPICFLITALVRTAQGSATVAMITAAPIAQSFAEAGHLGFHPVYLALAVGCGSKPIPWLNDSGFWIITRMAGMKETETLKIVTPMMSLMGLVGLPIVMLGAWLWPMR